MTQALTRSRTSQPALFVPSPDLSRLEVYRAAVDFQKVVGRFLARPRLGALRNQLDRASASVALNIAEGAGRFAPADKARHYLIARGSALECAAIFDVFEARGMGSLVERRHGSEILDRIIAMLTRLATNMQVRARNHER